MYYCLTDGKMAAVSKRELHMSSLRASSQVRDGKPEERYPLPPRRARVSRSVDRDFITRTSDFDQSSSNFRSPPQYTNPALPPFLLRRRLSLSAVPAASVTAEDTEYDLPPKSASQVRWSRKDVVYTAENMGFSPHESAAATPPKRTHIINSTRYRRMPKTQYADSKLLRSRAAYFVDDDLAYTNDHMLDVGERRRHRIRLRASSVPRMDGSVIRTARHTSPLVHRRRANSVVRTYAGPSYPTKSSSYGTAVRVDDNEGFDIASFVLAPGEQFIPTNVSVSVLPSGRRAVTYTRFSQKGTGDQHRANAEIDHIIQRTNRLQVYFLNACVIFRSTSTRNLVFLFTKRQHSYSQLDTQSYTKS